MPVILRALLVLFSSLALSISAYAQKPLYTIFTGTDKNAFFLMGQDIKRVCPQFDIQVIKTTGTLDNINQIIDGSVFQTGYRLGFIQGDVLETIISSEPRVQPLLKLVMNTHNIEITIIVNRDAKISNIMDLADKRVAIGPQSSGSWFTGTIIKNSLGLKWFSIERSIQEGLLGVLTGQIDALILTASQPYEIYSILGPSVKNRIKFLDMSEIPPLHYRSITLPSNTYEWQDYPIHALSINSMLMSDATVPANALANITSCIVAHQNDLIKTGHPKWKTIQFPSRSKIRG